MPRDGTLFRGLMIPFGGVLIFAVTYFCVEMVAASIVVPRGINTITTNLSPSVTIEDPCITEYK